MITDGQQTRFAGTDEFQQICEQAAKTDLDWFFEVYLRQPKLPRLHIERTAKELHLKWESPVENMLFPMPITITIDGRRRVLDMAQGEVFVRLSAKNVVEIDPNSWILMERVVAEQ